MIFENLIKVMRRPDDFFTSLKSELVFKPTLIYLAKFLVFSFIIYLGVGLVFLQLAFFWYLIFYSGILVILSFLTLIYFLIAKILKIKNAFLRTIQSMVFGFALYLLLAWIFTTYPGFAYAIVLYSAYLVIVGMKILYDVSWRRAILIFLSPMLFVSFITYVFLLI